MAPMVGGAVVTSPEQIAAGSLCHAAAAVTAAAGPQRDKPRPVQQHRDPGRAEWISHGRPEYTSDMGIVSLDPFRDNGR